MSDLIETLRRSLMFSSEVMEQDSLLYDEELPKVKSALSLLSDPNALLWALLEEMAGEVVVEELSPRNYLALPGRDWNFMIDGRVYARLSQRTNGEFDAYPYPQRQTLSRDCVPKMHLCLARAIQEQRKREAGVSDV